MMLQDTTEGWLDRLLNQVFCDTIPDTVAEQVDDEIIDAVEEARILKAYWIASEEGRLHPDLAREMGLKTGQFPCDTCGMLHFSSKQAFTCCDGVTFDPPIGRLQQKDYAGLVVNKGMFAAAVRADMMRRGITSTKYWETSIGVGKRSVSKMFEGESKWIKAHKWSRLQSVFGQHIPGCIPVTMFDDQEDEDE